MAGAQACLIYVMLVIQLTGILSIILIAVWLGQYGVDKGYGFNDSKKLLNLHALLMPIGVFLLANGIVMYRGFKKFAARNVKWAHFMFQLVGFIIIILGFTFTVMARDKQIQELKFMPGQEETTTTNQQSEPPSHKLGPKQWKHFYSVHSWLGLMFFIMVSLQFLGGLFAFLFKIIDKSSRELFAAVHAFFGIFITLLAGFVAVIGIEGKTKFDIASHDNLADEGVLANIASLAIVVMLAHVLYMSVNPFFEWDVNEDTLEANPIE